MSKSKKHNIHLGGGANKEVGQSSFVKSQSFFKPIVASSLALALGFSVASATITCTSTNGAPSICLSNNATTDVSNNPFNITWSAVANSSNQIYQMTSSNASNGNLSFYLEDGNYNTNGTKVSINTSGGYKAQIDKSIS